MSTYGVEPQVGLQTNIDIREMMFYMYLPIRFPEHSDREMFEHVPERLAAVKELLLNIPQEEMEGKYVYVTCKRTYVTPEYMANRKGWHCDGFMTDDINYIWYDSAPTEFCLHDYDMPLDDVKSLDYMERQSKLGVIVTYPCRTLLKLDQYNVHRVSEIPYEGMRTFIKISISDKKFNLEGNARNYLMDYNWHFHNRGEIRNMECNDDFVETS